MNIPKLFIPALSISLSILSISYSTFQNDRAINAEILSESLQKEVTRLEEREKDLLLEICDQANTLQKIKGWPHDRRLNCETFALYKQQGLKRNPVSLLAPIVTR